MQVGAGSEAGQEARAALPWWQRDLGLLAVLLLLTLSLRIWLLTHTEVAARDSIGFIRYGLQFENQPWADVLRSNHQHPGYPLSILGVSWPVRWFLGAEPNAFVMQLSAQLASSLAALLLIFPMYYLGKGMLSRGAGFWAAVLFQVLPVSGHVLSDGLSESLFLLLTATTLMCAAYALQYGSLWRFALCGVFCGLTYLTRPEGAALVLATGAALVMLQLVPRWRRPWKAALGQCVVLVVAAVVAGSPYFLATHQFTNKPSGQEIFAEHDSQDGSPVAVLAGSPTPLLAVVVPTDGALGRRLWVGLWGLGSELAKSFQYVVWLPALLGMWWNRRRIFEAPGMLVTVLLCALHALVLWRLIVLKGYLSDRHVLVLVLGGVYPAASAMLELPERVERWLPRIGGARASAAWSLVLFVALVGVCLPRTLQKLHWNRAGHHAAGLWLAQHAQPADVIDDSHCWAHYYAGRVFVEGKPPAPAERPRWCYTVIGRSRERDQGVPLSQIAEETLRRHGHTIVYHWPPQRALDGAEVVVYAAPLTADQQQSP